MVGHLLVVGLEEETLPSTGSWKELNVINDSLDPEFGFERLLQPSLSVL